MSTAAVHKLIVCIAILVIGIGVGTAIGQRSVLAGASGVAIGTLLLLLVSKKKIGNG